MSQATKPGRASAPEAPAGLPAASRLPLVPTLVWLGATVLALFLQGCPAFGWAWILDVVFTLGLCGSELAFLDRIYRKGRGDLVPAWKKFTGYALVLAYVFQSLPRATWSNDGVISGGRAAFIFALSLLCLAAGFAAFVLMGRPKVYAAFGLITEEEVKDRKLRKKNRGLRRKPGFLHGLLEWVDAIAFAAIAVIFINIFVFQLYVIPSESMVPSFLMGDRPFTVKLTMGPRIPLTNWRLPSIDRPRRGDIVTLANPRYEENHEVNIRKQLSQFVYMLTFTAVNLDKDANGEAKPDPLVKRVVGVPGDKLMMIDDVVYVRRQGEADFSPLEADRNWARVDLWKEDLVPISKIKQLPIDEATRKSLSAWDARKNGLDFASASADFARYAREIPALAASRRGRNELSPSSAVSALRDEAQRGAGSDAAEGALWIARNGLALDDLDLALAVAAVRNEKVAASLAAYAADGAKAALAESHDAYERGSRAFSLILKENLLARVERALVLLGGKDGLAGAAQDAVLSKLRAEAQELRIYFYFWDSRNFPAFPAGDAYLGPDQYFAMGDNRYNSLDFRFSDRSHERAVDSADPSSPRYRSLLEPFALERSFIEGKAAFILWPFSRAGAIRQ